MTQDEYRLALKSIRLIEQGTLMSIENDRVRIKEALYDTKSISRSLEENFEILKECAQDRVALVRWFWESRIGNPPVLKTIYLTADESRGL